MLNRPSVEQKMSYLFSSLSKNARTKTGWSDNPLNYLVWIWGEILNRDEMWTFFFRIPQKSNVHFVDFLSLMV